MFSNVENFNFYIRWKITGSDVVSYLSVLQSVKHSVSD